LPQVVATCDKKRFSLSGGTGLLARSRNKVNRSAAASIVAFSLKAANSPHGHPCVSAPASRKGWNLSRGEALDGLCGGSTRLVHKSPRFWQTVAFNSKIMVKTIFRFLAAVATCVALAAPLQASAYDQWWRNFNVGPLDSFGILALGGSSLAIPGVTSNAAGWTEFGNSTAAFATFADTTDMYFNVHIQSSSAEFAVFSWYRGVMKDSALLNTSNVVIAEPYVGPPLPFDMYSADNMAQFKALAAPVPEPGTYAMLLSGLAVIASIARRRTENR
jgi:hypothetical protein